MTNTPISVDLPHSLGTEEAKRRIDGGIHKLTDFLPGGGAEVRSAWTGDQLGLQVMALGQEVNARLDVQDRYVRVELLLPPASAFFGDAVAAALRKRGADMLEDRSSGRNK